MSRRDSSSSDEKSTGESGTSLPPSGETASSVAAPSIVPAATVYTPTNRSFVVDQDAQYPHCTYKEQ